MMRDEYDSLVEAIRDMREEFPDADHFIVNSADAADSDMQPHICDDGTHCYIVDGTLVFVSDLCPPGQIGASVDEEVPDYSVN